MNVDVRRAETVQQNAAKKRQLLGIIDKLEEEPHALVAVAEQGLPGTSGARDTGLAAMIAECGRTLTKCGNGLTHCHLGKGGSMTWSLLVTPTKSRQSIWG